MTDTVRVTDPEPDSESASEVVALGVELLSELESSELSVADAVDRIETVTTNPTLTRRILDTAEKRGIIARENGIIKPTGGGGHTEGETEVVTKDGEFSCQRCGKRLTTGYFLRFDAGDHGPFGPECIKKVTGRA